MMIIVTCLCSVLFNFLGRDFFNALSQKDAERFTQMLFKWLGGIALGVPVFVYRDYLQVQLLSCLALKIVCHPLCPSYSASIGLDRAPIIPPPSHETTQIHALNEKAVCMQSRLSLEWRDYMTRKLTEEYFHNSTFYQIQSGALIDNPDQRISSDVR